MADKFDLWWHGVPALPISREDHDYFALRRVWGDHTMSGNRGFYNPRSEDHLTVSLFQTFAAFTGTGWASRLLSKMGLSVPDVSRVRFAYACEELLDSRLAHKHGRNLIIPDLILHWESAEGLGLVAFEVKKPGGAMPNTKDMTKLESYADLPSMRHIPTRVGCFLVDKAHVPALRTAGATAISWDDVLEVQLEALRDETMPSAVMRVFEAHLRSHFAVAGVGRAAIAPASDLRETYKRADALSLPERLKALICGFSICANRRAGAPIASSPFEWLQREPTIEVIRASKRQSTSDRKINRWSFDWMPAREGAW